MRLRLDEAICRISGWKWIQDARLPYRPADNRQDRDEDKEPIDFGVYEVDQYYVLFGV